MSPFAEPEVLALYTHVQPPHPPRARRVSLAAGAILLGWIGTQVALIGYVSWLQPAVALAALANVTLAWWLPHDGRVAV